MGQRGAYEVLGRSLGGEEWMALAQRMRRCNFLEGVSVKRYIWVVFCSFQGPFNGRAVCCKGCLDCMVCCVEEAAAAGLLINIEGTGGDMLDP